MRRIPSLFRLTSAGMLVLVLAACTPGGQFDPTTLLQSDMFDSKKKLQGDRAPVFPGGVPGTTTGVPPDLVKGYQPPPEQTEAAAAQPAEKPKPKPKVATQTPPKQPPTRISIGSKPSALAQPAEKPKPKPKPKVATQTPPKQPPTRISIGTKPNAPVQPAAASQQPAQQIAAPPGQSQSVWPSTPPTAPAQQQQQSQSVWPNPPATTSH